MSQDCCHKMCEVIKHHHHLYPAAGCPYFHQYILQDKLGNYWKDNRPSRAFDHLQKNCNGSETVEAVLDCINNKTFSLGEAIRGMHAFI